MGKKDKCDICSGKNTNTIIPIKKRLESEIQTKMILFLFEFNEYRRQYNTRTF